MPNCCRALMMALLGIGLTATAQAEVKNVVAKLETQAYFDDDAGGNADADDPAIWVHMGDRARSLVIATLKEGGLAVFNLKGEEIQHIPAPPPPRPGDRPGRFNNVDVLPGFDLNGRKVDLAIVTDRGQDRLRIYAVNPDYHLADQPPLTDITAAKASPWLFSSSQDEVNEQNTAYGLAVTNYEGYGPVVGVVSQRHRANLRRVVFYAVGNHQVGYRLRGQLALPNEFKLPNRAVWTPCQDDDGVQAQVEGMVIDGLHGVLYAAQEQVGVWRIPFTDGFSVSGKPVLMDKVRGYGVPYDRVFNAEDEEYSCEFKADPGFGGKNLTQDAEGLAIYPGKFGKGYLLVSSQGDSTFSVYQREADNAYLGTFQFVDGAGVDGVQHSDGAAVTNYALGPDYPNGLFVAHDGENTPEVLDGEVRSNTNFKFVPWPDIANAFGGTLKVETLR